MMEIRFQCLPLPSPQSHCPPRLSVPFLPRGLTILSEFLLSERLHPILAGWNRLINDELRL